MSIAPGTAASNAGYRTLMGMAGATLTRRQGRAVQAVRAALFATARGRASAGERAWLDRIGAERDELQAGLLAEIAPPDDRPMTTNERRKEAADACLWMSLPPVIGALLMNLVRALRPGSCLELGTGFGISTSYQAAALELNGRGHIATLDIDGMHSMARTSIRALGLDSRVELVSGRIEGTLEAAVEAAAPIDYALLDADHNREPTIAAFETLLPRLAPEAVLVFDDVNWNDGMREAWRAIRRGRRVLAAVTLHRLGIAIVGSEP